MSARRKLIIVFVALITAAVAGGAYAATQGTSQGPRQAFLNDVAKRLNVSPAKLHSALNAAMVDRLKAAVAAGRITQAQANAIERRIAQGDGAPLLRHRFFGGSHFGAPDHGPLGAAASYLGVSPMTLMGDLRGGKSLAQIAKARGKSVTGLHQAMVTALRSRLDRAVAAKMITKSQEQRILSRISARLTEKINHAGFGPRFGGPPASAPDAPPAGAPDGPGGPPGGGHRGLGFFGAGAAAPAPGAPE